jgi:hypothetical protein
MTGSKGGKMEVGEAMVWRVWVGWAGEAEEVERGASMVW